MTDEPPAAVSKLPERPLTVAEGKQLDAQQTESAWIRPESILLRDGEAVVVALLAINRETDRCWLLGYSPRKEGWILLDKWAYEDLDRDSFYELLDQWEADTFAGRSEWSFG